MFGFRNTRRMARRTNWILCEAVLREILSMKKETHGREDVERSSKN